MDIDEMIVYSRTVPAKGAEYADYPMEMLPELAGYLRQRGIERLYSHQAEMFELALQGENVVITTSTASGKTLSFLLPVLQEILRNPRARAVFVYPTKALASDQYKALRPLPEYFGEDRISAGVYDGDTAPAERSRILEAAGRFKQYGDRLAGSRDSGGQVRIRQAYDPLGEAYYLAEQARRLQGQGVAPGESRYLQMIPERLVERVDNQHLTDRVNSLGRALSASGQENAAPKQSFPAGCAMQNMDRGRWRRRLRSGL